MTTLTALIRFLRACALTLAGIASFEAGASNIEVQANSATTGYNTLKEAFDAINLGTHTGVIVISVNGDTNEGAATAVLNASGAGAASYSAISILPVGGVARTISGAAAAGVPMIDCNGADNVTIDGLNTDGNSLTISNATVSATTGTSTIRFQADATNNTITNCTVLGSATMAAGTNGGTIWFGSAAIATGNDNNTISNCNLGPAGANLPSKAIHFNGSSNSDPGTANSGIVIINNNIFDYFSATVSSAGIDLNSGTVRTTISNNRFYQSAPRTMTVTGLTHSGIRLGNASGNAFQITGNTIGFANSAGTGAYSVVFPTTTTGAFIPLNIAVNTVTVTNITSNTIAGIALSGGASGTGTSAPFRAIYVATGLATANNNTIGSQSSTGSITYTSASTSASDVIGIGNFGASNWTTNNNTVGGISAANSSTGAANIHGLRTNTTSGLTWTCQNNTIGGAVANSIQSTSTAAGTTVQGIRNENPIGTLTGNTVRNLTAAGGTGTTTAASVIGMNFTVSSANQTLSQNTIFGLTNSNAAGATIVTGIQFNGSTSNVVARNQIYGLSSATNSAAAEVNGIRVGGGTTVYRNNMIAIGAGVANAMGAGATNSGTSGVNGINAVLGTDSFFHNSVYIGGSPAAGAGASYAFNGSQTTNTRSFRDNIFFNARSNSGATGRNYAVKINGTAANPAGLTINNNVYFANGAGGVFGFFNSLDVAGMGAWRTAVGQDASSFEVNPQYLDPAGATPDLHVNPAVLTAIESNGVDVGVTDDFDGQTRSGLTPVDIGADAGDFRGIDITAPGIAYTPLSDTVSTSNRVFTATITDAGSGVPVSGGGLPVIYYRKGTSGAFASSQAISSGGSSYDFTINYSLVTGGSVAVGNTIQYYVIAQDAAPAPNAASSPSAGASGFTTDPPAVSTPPTTLNSYLIKGAIAGAFTVGTAGNYPTLTAAVADLNINKIITGPVVLTLLDASYSASETFPITINANAGSSAINTLMIKPAPGVTAAITGSSATALIVLNGADWVIIDGSNAGSASRDLTVTNTNAGTAAAVVWLQTTSGADATANNTIKNLNVAGSGGTQTNLGIGSGGTTIGTPGIGNHQNTFRNNSITKCQTGIYSAGQSAANMNQGTVIAENVMDTAPPNAIGRYGIFATFENNIVVTQNVIAGIQFNGSGDVGGISLGLAFNSTTNAVSASVDVTNATVTGNVIGGIAQTNAFSAVGIAVGATSGTTTIANNFIYGVASNGTGTDFCAGIYAIGGAGTTTRVYFNSVSMTGTAAGGTQGGFALAIGGTGPVVDARNNIFLNTQPTGTGISYAIGTSAATFASLTSDNNAFFTTTGALFGMGKTGSLAPGSGTSHTTLTAWRTATGKDANSVFADPFFTSTTNLHISAENSPVVSAGVPLAGITTDIDLHPRSAVPDIGADEFFPSVNPNLSNLLLGSGTLSPVFDGDTIAYTAMVTNATGSISVTPTSVRSTATIKVNESTVASGVASGAITLAEGDNTISIVVTAQDGIATKTYTVSVHRNIKPVLTLPASPIVAEATSSTGRVVTFNVTATDAEDGALTPTVLPVTGSTFAIGDTTVNVSATDTRGETVTGSFTVTVQDTIAPVVDAHANVSVPATSAAGATVTYAAGSATDAVGVTSLTYSQNSGTNFPLGTTTVTITARDAANNTGTGTFTVTVTNNAPVVTLAGSNPLTFEAAASYTDPGATATDVEDGTLTPAITSNTVAAKVPGTYAVTWRATDSANSTGSVTRVVNVVDTTAPVIQPHADVINNTATNLAGVVVNYIAATATDVVGVASITYSKNSGTVFPLGRTPVTVNAVDAAGNPATPTQFDVIVHLAAPVSVSQFASGAPAPGAGTNGLPADAKIASFNTPAIDDAGNIAFAAKWTSNNGKAKGTGLFLNDECLAFTPGDPPISGASYKSFSDPVVDGGKIACIAALTGTPKPPATVVLSNAATAGALEVIAQAGGTATADGAKFKSFKAVDVAGDYVAIFAQLAAGTGTTPKVSVANDLGLWVKDGAGALTLALREGQGIAGKVIKNLVTFAPGAGSPGQGRGWLRNIAAAPGGQVMALALFADKSQGIVVVDADDIPNPIVLSLTGQTGDGSPDIADATFASYGFPALAENDTSAFLASLTVGTAGVTKANARGIFHKPALAGDYAPLVRLGDPAVAGATFSLLKDPVLSADGGLAFPATIKGGTVKGAAMQTIWWKPAGENLTLLAQGGARPGNDLPAEAQWKAFTSLAIADGRGPIFAATLVPGKGGVLKSSAAGVWACDFTGAPRLLFRAGDMIGGKTLKSFKLLNATVGSLSVTRSFNAAAQVVWLATFTDKTTAIITAEVP